MLMVHVSKAGPCLCCTKLLMGCSVLWESWVWQLETSYSGGCHCRKPGMWDEERLLHSHSLMAVGLSVGYGTWPPIGWHHPLMIGWFRYSLGLPQDPVYCGFMWQVGISIIFKRPPTVPLHSPNDRHMPAIRAVQMRLWKSLRWGLQQELPHWPRCAKNTTTFSYPVQIVIIIIINKTNDLLRIYPVLCGSISHSRLHNM